MERSEPSLVPEWLKGASSGVGGATHHSQMSSNFQDESGGSFASWQRGQPHGLATGGSHVDYESPRLTAQSSDRAYYSAVRRGGAGGGGGGGGGGSSGVNDRLLTDRETYSQHSRGYTNFGRSPAYRSYDAGIDRSERDSSSRDREWDWDRDREREGRDRERVLGGYGGGGAEDRDRDRVDRSDSSSAFRRPGLGSNSGTRYETDVSTPIRRVQSMGSAARALENGDKKTGELGGLPTAPPSNSGSLTSSMQKAAFERNFPSLGVQERVGISVNSLPPSNLVSAGVLSPRPLWQGSATPRVDGSRSTASSPGPPTGGNPSTGLTSGSGGGGGGGGSSGEGWSSALAEVPSALTGGGGFAASNGTLVAPMTSSSTATVSSAAAAAAASLSLLTTLSTAGTSVIAPKMAEALVQNPPRARTPPQQLAETQRLEELALKQSRQLIPMIPKTMGLIPRDKLKPKVVRAVDVVAPPSIMKVKQPPGAPQVLSSAYRPPGPLRPDTLKPVQAAGKVLIRKSNKEGVSGVLSPSQVSSGLKHESPQLPATAGGASIGNAAVGGALNSATAVRKPKQLLDRRAVPIPPISVAVGSDGNAGVRSKDSGNPGAVTGNDERRPSLPTQNRVDFFNALRKKAGLGSTSSVVDKLDVAAAKKTDVVNGKEVQASLPIEEEVVHLSEDEGGDNAALVESYQLENGDSRPIDVTPDSDAPAPRNDKPFVERMKGKENGLVLEEAIDDQLFEEADGASQPPVVPVALGGGAMAGEEEEAAFLRSLGWEESAEGGCLTQEEINSFYQRRNEWTTSLPAARKLSDNHHHHPHHHMDLHVGSVGSETSGVTTSDSESDDECQVRRGGR